MGQRLKYSWDNERWDFDVPSQSEHRSKLEGWEPPLRWGPLPDAKTNPGRMQRFSQLVNLEKNRHVEIVMARGITEGTLAFVVRVADELFSEIGPLAPTEEFVARICVALEFNPSVRKEND